MPERAGTDPSTVPASARSRASGQDLDASVVICAYTEERWDALVAAVRSACEQNRKPTDVIVVVDHNEALLARASRQLTDATVVPNRNASGLSGARNTGAGEARGSVVAFLDDDAAAASDWLELLIAPLADPDVLGTGGRIDPAWQSGRPRWFPPEFDWVVGCTYRGMPQHNGEIRNPIGASMALRRSTLAELGGFRTDSGPRRNAPAGGGGTAGTDETELSIRAAKRWPAGRWLYVPTAQVSHRVPPQRATWRFFRNRCRDEGRAKAALAALSGRTAALASERSYAARELPKAVGRGIADAVTRADPGGLLRAAAVIVGLAEAAAGYASWYVRNRRSP